MLGQVGVVCKGNNEVVYCLNLLTLGRGGKDNRKGAKDAKVAQRGRAGVLI